MNITQPERGGNGESVTLVNHSLRGCFRLFTGPFRRACCSKSSLTFESLTALGILLTVQGRKAFGPIAGSGIDTMFEAVTAFFGVMSAGIFIAHAVDGYRSRS
jgi:hypothetical protein